MLLQSGGFLVFSHPPFLDPQGSMAQSRYIFLVAVGGCLEVMTVTKDKPHLQGREGEGLELKVSMFFSREV